MEAAVRLLVGTTKGVFLLVPDAGRQAWDVRGPHCDGWPINHAIGDPASGELWAAGGGEWAGAGVWRSGDGGATWMLSKSWAEVARHLPTILCVETLELA